MGGGGGGGVWFVLTLSLLRDLKSTEQNEWFPDMYAADISGGKQEVEFILRLQALRDFHHKEILCLIFLFCCALDLTETSSEGDFGG